MEHLACSAGSVFAHAVWATDADAVLMRLTRRRVDWCAIPLTADDGDIVVLFAAEPFAVANPATALAELVSADGQISGRLSTDDAVARLLAVAHAPEAGRVRFSEAWGLIARGENEGNTKGTFKGG
jgi:hypothetical protein